MKYNFIHPHLEGRKIYLDRDGRGPFEFRFSDYLKGKRDDFPKEETLIDEIHGSDLKFIMEISCPVLFLEKELFLSAPMMNKSVDIIIPEIEFMTQSQEEFVGFGANYNSSNLSEWLNADSSQFSVFNMTRFLSYPSSMPEIGTTLFMNNKEKEDRFGRLFPLWKNIPTSIHLKIDFFPYIVEIEGFFYGSDEFVDLIPWDKATASLRDVRPEFTI